MRDCTGAEIFAEVLYHCGLEDEIPGILAHTTVSTAMMPYITSQFMPRKISDRPRSFQKAASILRSSASLSSCRAMCLYGGDIGSYRDDGRLGLTGLSKPMIPMYEPVYDLRVIIASLKATLGIDEITPESLKAIAAAGRRCPLCSPSSTLYRCRSYENPDSQRIDEGTAAHPPHA